MPQQFVDLNKYGADKLKDQWLPWKWEQSLAADGKTQIGLGTDIGSLAICYRKDLFKKAGLPTDRDAGVGAVARLAVLHQHRPEVPGERASRHALLRLGQQRATTR